MASHSQRARSQVLALFLQKNFVILVAVFVPNEFTDAHLTEFLLSAFDTVFVLLAYGVEVIDWLTITRIRHCPITDIQAIASVSPVLSLIEVRVVVCHHVDKLIVAFLTFKGFVFYISFDN